MIALGPHDALDDAIARSLGPEHPVKNPLPRLVDRADLRAELGVSRAVADAIFRELPTVHVPGVRRCYVRAADVERAVERWTRVDP